MDWGIVWKEHFSWKVVSVEPNRLNESHEATINGGENLKFLKIGFQDLLLRKSRFASFWWEWGRSGRYLRSFLQLRPFFLPSPSFTTPGRFSPSFFHTLWHLLLSTLSLTFANLMSNQNWPLCTSLVTTTEDIKNHSHPHANLVSSVVLFSGDPLSHFENEGFPEHSISFNSLSGHMLSNTAQSLFQLEFPARIASEFSSLPMQTGSWIKCEFRFTLPFSSDSCNVDAPSTFGVRTRRSLVLSLKISSLSLISFTIYWRSTKHLSMKEAYNLFKDLANNANTLRGIRKQASFFSLQVQDLLWASAIIEVGIKHAYGPKTDPSSGVQWSTM